MQIRYTMFDESEAAKTLRGFGILHFDDDYETKCSIQESSSCEPHVWLGIDKPEIKIMYKDAVKTGLLEMFNLKKDAPECNECGWCTITLPDEVSIFSRMHLNRRQALELGHKLIDWAKKDTL